MPELGVTQGLTLWRAPVLAPPECVSPPPSPAGSPGRGPAGRRIGFPVGAAERHESASFFQPVRTISVLTGDTGGPRYPAPA